MDGREYLGCLIALAAICLIGGVPFAVVAGIVLVKLFGAFIVLGLIAVAFVAAFGGVAAVVAFVERLRNRTRE